MKEEIALTGADQQILELIQQFPFISTIQLMRLRGVRHLPTMQSKLVQLHRKGLLARRRLPVLDRPGNSEYLYHISPLGSRVLDPDSFNLPRSRSDDIAEGYIHLNHAHTLNQVLVAGYLLPSVAPGIILSEMRSDLNELKRHPLTVSYECAFPTGGHGTEKTTIIPDAFFDFRLEGTDKQRVYLIELDMGSLDNLRLRRKMRSYYHLGVSDIYVQTFGTDLIRVVYICLTEKRAALLRELCELELQLQNLEEENNLYRFGVLPASLDSTELFCTLSFYRPFDSEPVSLLWNVTRF